MIDEPSRRDLLARAAKPVRPIGPLATRALRTGARLRRSRPALSAAISAAAVVAISVLIVTLTGAAGRPPTTVTAAAKPAQGPSAWQLAHGRWVRIPPAPLMYCGILTVWDGRDLVVIRRPYRGCPPGATEYNPRANRWTTIAAPPMVEGQSAVAASGGGQVLLVLDTGATYSWRPATGRWQPLDKLPAGAKYNFFSVTWTGTTFLVTRLYHFRTPGPGQAFKLTGHRWKSLPDLPQPTSGRMEEAPAVAFHGAIYVLAHITVTRHAHPNSFEETGYVELLRLTATGWARVPLGPGGPKSDLALTQVRGAILAAGSSCPAMCTEASGIAALLRPGLAHSVIRLRPRPGVWLYPPNVAAGARAIVVTYAAPSLPGHHQPPRVACSIYDVATGTWQRGPTAPADIGGSDYWTPYGVITFGEPSGKVPDPARISEWILRPAGKPSARQ